MIPADGFIRPFADQRLKAARVARHLDVVDVEVDPETGRTTVLRYLVVLVQERSVSRAAEALHLTQPAMSRVMVGPSWSS